ncbi:MAG: nuclear transport factor 2 family protein [Microlunatus sp.]
MSTTDSVRAVIDAYIDADTTGGPLSDLLTDEISIELVGSDRAAHGRAEAERYLRKVNVEAFDSTREFVSVTIDEQNGRAAAEILFKGRQIGEYVGIPATGRIVRVPYSVHVDVADGRISAMRVYALLPGLISALTS